jgi:FkbM family methyltransferase
MSSSVRSMLRTAISWDPALLGWTRRMYLGLGLGGRTESDYLFDVLRTRKDVYLLQIGANDGRRNDEARQFIHKYRWRGLLLEPLPDIFSALQDNYTQMKQITLVNAALADCDGEMTFYRVKPGPDIPDFCNQLGSFSLETILKHRTLFPAIEQHIVTQKVQTLTFPTLMQQHGVQKIDAIIIDTEGYDFQILKMLDLRQFRPALIMYEHKHLKQEDRDAAVQLLSDAGYDVHRIRSENTAAVLKAERAQQ